MTEADRTAALQVLKTIRPMLKRIGTGWLFCLDRGYPWMTETEDREGRAEIARALADHPIVAERMPKIAGQLAAGKLLGDVDGVEEVDAATADLSAGATVPANAKES